MVTSPFLLMICRMAGTGLAITSLWLTVQFGLSISVGMAFALGVISLMASYIWPIAIEVHRNAGSEWIANAVKVGAVVVAFGVTGIDAITNGSTTGTHRVTDVHEARFQNTKASNATDQLADARKTLAMQTARLADLKKSQGWNASVTPTELQSRMETAAEAIRQEERRGGCGPKCLALKNERDKLAATLGAVTEHNRLADMILATQAHIQKLGRQVADTPPTVSSVDTQNKKLASLFTLDRNPGEGATFWTDTWMMVVIGLIITLASQFFNMVAWLPGKPTHMPTQLTSNVARETPRPREYTTLGDAAAALGMTRGATA